MYSPCISTGSIYELEIDKIVKNMTSFWPITKHMSDKDYHQAYYVLYSPAYCWCLKQISKSIGMSIFSSIRYRVNASFLTWWGTLFTSEILNQFACKVYNYGICS